MRLAAIDVGSNSVKLLVADRTSTGLREVLTLLKITRLSEGQGRHRRLQPRAVDRTLRALSQFQKAARSAGATGLTAVATQAVRTAANGEAFLRRCRRDLHLPLRRISGREEARLSFLGGTSGLEKASVTAVDIGGGSTEIMTGAAGVLASALSIPIGAVTLHERFLPSDPPPPREIAEAEGEARSRLRPLSRLPRHRVLTAIGGTASTLALLQRGGTPEKLHGIRIPLPEVNALFLRLCSMTLARRRRVRGMDPERADILPAGLILLRAGAELLDARTLQISTRGLRHGLLLDPTEPIMSPL